MLIQLHGKQADNYKEWLAALEREYKRKPDASERTEAFFCAIKGENPNWIRSLQRGV